LGLALAKPSLLVNLTFQWAFWQSLEQYRVSSQNAHLLKLFSPLLPTLPQFEQNFFILSASVAATAAFAAFFPFFPFFPILSSSNEAEEFSCPPFYFSP